MTPLAEQNNAAVYHCDWRDLLTVVPAADALIVDAPYSERTHAGHDAPTESLDRRSIDYSFWTVTEVRDFVEAWSPRIRGWFASITDHVLAIAWTDALAHAGRYVFAPLPFVAPGSRVRLAGDGPSNWTTWIVVGRPRTKEYATWGTLPGAYVLPAGQGGSMPVVGGKPVWLACELAEAYSREGELIVDPCCGAGTSLIGAVRRGRRAIGGDSLQAHAELAAKWIANPWRQAPSAERDEAGESQMGLF